MSTDIRHLIDLIEAKGKVLELNKLPYGRSALAPVMSQATIDYHYGKLARGYVDRFNAGNTGNNGGTYNKDFNEAGAFLHNIFFPQMQTPKNTNHPKGASLALIDQRYGSFKDFKEKMKIEAMKIQGSGWIYMARNGEIKTIKNHQIKNDIALLIDWWEHAWAKDYGADKAKYFDRIWRIINWDKVNSRIASGK